MIRFLVLLAAVLVAPAVASACERVQAFSAPVATYAAPLQVVAQPIYQPQVLAVEVAHYEAQPVVLQQIVVKQQRQRRQPVKAFVQAVTPNRCHCR